MKRFSKELKIGITVLIAAVVLLCGIEYLKGINVFKAANYYYVSYTNVGTLTVSSPVTLDGFKVGQVRAMEYEYENPGHVKVEISLDRRLKVPSGSVAMISSDILGTASIVLKLSDNGDVHAVGDHIIGELEPSMIENVGNKVMPVMDNILPKVDSLLTSVNRLLADSALLASVKRLDAITANLEATTRSLKNTVATAPSTMKTVDGVAQNLDTITRNLTVLTDEINRLPLASTMANVDSITANLSDITRKANSTDNTVGALLNDRTLYDHLTGTAAGLDSIMAELKRNPKKYIPSIKVF